MSRARQKGTTGENFFLHHLRQVFGPSVERAPLKGVLDQGDFVNVPWLHESKNTQKPLFQQWARTAEKKALRWVVMWKGDLRSSGNGPYVLMPLHLYLELVSKASYLQLRGSSVQTDAEGFVIEPLSQEDP